MFRLMGYYRLTKKDTSILSKNFSFPVQLLTIKESNMHLVTDS